MKVIAYLNSLPENTEKLDISDKKLTNKDLKAVIAYVIEKNWPLRELNFSGNRVTELPDSLGKRLNASVLRVRSFASSTS